MLAVACMLIVGLVVGLQIDVLRDIGDRHDAWPWTATLGRLYVQVVEAAQDDDARARVYRSVTRRARNGVMAAVLKDGVVVASPFDDFTTAEAYEAHRLLAAGLPKEARGDVRANVELNIPRRVNAEVSYQYAPQAAVWVITFCVNARKNPGYP